MDDRGDDGGVGAARGKRVEQMARFARAARGDHRDSHPIRDHPGYFEIVAGLGAVGVDRIDAQFAGAEAARPRAPTQSASRPVGVRPPSIMTSWPEGRPARSGALDLHREHNALAAKGARAGRNQARIAHRARVDRDFSAPASSTARMSSSVRKPPPTLNGMKISRATARTTSIMIPRRSLEAVMS